MNRNLVFYLLTVLFVAMAAWKGNEIIHGGKDYKHQMERVTNALSFKKRLLKPDEWLFPGHFWEVRSKKADKIAHQAEEAFEGIKTEAFILLGAAVLYAVIIMVLFAGTPVFHRMTALMLAFLSFTLLIIGLFCPMMEIAALHDNLHVPIQFKIPFIDQQIDLSRNFEGRIYYFYQNKSIVDVITVLFKSGNILVASCLFLFSALFPLVKLVFTVISVYATKWRENKVISFMIHTLGKWSMADVMVAACFLAYLSFANMRSGVQSEANILPGMYFFLSFVILSMMSSVFLKMHDKRMLNDVSIEPDEE